MIVKHTVDMFHGTISWKIKSLFYRNFGKISAQLPIELVSVAQLVTYDMEVFCTKDYQLLIALADTNVSMDC